MYEVEDILDHYESDHGTVFYQIKWKGYALKDATWEPSINLPEDLVNEYYENQADSSIDFK